MNELQMSDLTGFNWAGLWDSVRTLGMDFGIKAVIAIVIFYVGRIIARLVTKGLRNIMQSHEVDKILESFVCNLVHWTLMMTIAITALIPQSIKADCSEYGYAT